MQTPSNRPDICLYHANCMDGFGAAYAVWKRYGNDVVYIPMHYGQNFWETMAMEGVTGAQLRYCLVDFSLPRDVLMAISAQGHAILVIDHHKTAEAALTDVPFDTVFDMQHSGAWLTHQYFHPAQQIPSLIEYIEDRDLWTWKLYASQEVSLFLWAEEQTFQNFQRLEALFEQCEQLGQCITAGQAILRYAAKQVEIMAQRFTLRDIGGLQMPVVNATCLFSEVGDWLCQLGHEAAAYWFQRGTVYQWGLRSRGTVDVSAIAQQYGGGGHAAAAGFVRTASEHAHLLTDTPRNC